MDILTLAAGTDGDATVTLFDADGAVVTSFVSADAPAAVVWAGDDQTALYAPTVAWTDPTKGTLLLSFLGAGTATLNPSRYLVRVTITRHSDSRVFDVWDGYLDITASPGSAPALATYCSYNDMLLYAPWLKRDQTLADQAGFAEQRAAARKWLEEIVLSKFRTNYSNLHNTLGDVNPVLTPSASGAQSPWLIQQLAANNLKLTPTVVEATARYAVALVCESAIGPDDDENNYTRLARTHMARAKNLVKTLVAQIMPPNQTTSSYPVTIINCGTASFR